MNALPYDFTALPNARQASESEKWNQYPSDTIPMWVADSDYAVAPEITAALQQRLQHPVLGYGKTSEKLKKLIVERAAQKYHWQIKPEWICFIPGVVGGLNIARAIMGEPGSQAITAKPVYPHLINGAPLLGQGMQFYPMLNQQTKNQKWRYTPDFEALKATLTAQTRMLMICNPHNPVGTVYHADELANFAAIAEANDLLICSDDIHADFVLDTEAVYRPIASLSPAVSQRTITLMAASKTFNIAGLNCAFAIIENPDIRTAFVSQVKGLIGGVNILGLIATEAAYEYGDDWHQAQLTHLRENAHYCYARINAMPLLSMNALEATYLAWVDASKLNALLASQPIKDAYHYLLHYKVAVSNGEAFGVPSFIRLNLATDRATLQAGLDRIEAAVMALMDGAEG